jgi:hypothetical protein
MSQARAKTILADDFSPYRIAEFWSKVNFVTAGGCWEFNGSTRVGGYGVVEMRGRTSRAHRRVLAHRAAYAMQWGKCPALSLIHSCDNPRCVNPAHLTPGTHAENMQDMVRKGRHWTARRSVA